MSLDLPPPAETDRGIDVHVLDAGAQGRVVLLDCALEHGLNQPRMLTGVLASLLATSVVYVVDKELDEFALGAVCNATSVRHLLATGPDEELWKAHGYSLEVRPPGYLRLPISAAPPRHPAPV